MSREQADRAWEMEVLARIVTCGSLSGAARVLKLSPSGVSRILDRLEARLGVRLVVRTTRRLSLTPEGEAYHWAATRILADLDEAEREATEGGALRGRVRVDATLPFGQRCIVPLLPAFLAAHPGIRIDLTLSDRVSDLVDARTDVAIRVGHLPDSGLMARKLLDNRRLVVAAPAYLARHGTPQAPEDLAGHNCLELNFARAARGWPFRVEGARRVVAVSGNVEANNGETLRALCVAGLGIARLGAFLVRDDLEAGRLVTLLDAHDSGETEPIQALHVGGARVPRRVRAFVDFLAANLPAPR
ncbi:LysR family transcriptional regulator [Methylobacterium organophilum]|uniref:HTH-type transcriptional regulator DmlR n=1 Tax=Methylobacterium organophilum TaxID=410 RepID=A0ABQ4T5J9_METOR|nr:LysR family transcriptional regulator [Methylobacterium organophilum]GJE26195.1 HTH-type transcriptional regulator DmlR [Methylobacterium organophilum]